MTYQPRPGSIGERSLAYLAEHGRTSLPDLADGIESETNGIGASLSLCISNGLILREEVKGRTYYELAKVTPDDEQAALLTAALGSTQASQQVAAAFERQFEQIMRPTILDHIRDAGGRVEIRVKVGHEEVVQDGVATLLATSETESTTANEQLQVGDLAIESLSTDEKATIPIGEAHEFAHDETPVVASNGTAESKFQNIENFQTVPLQVLPGNGETTSVQTTILTHAEAREVLGIPQSTIPVDHFEFALFTDGRLLIEIDGIEVRFSTERATRLRNLFARMDEVLSDE